MRTPASPSPLQSSRKHSASSQTHSRWVTLPSHTHSSIGRPLPIPLLHLAQPPAASAPHAPRQPRNVAVAATSLHCRRQSRSCGGSQRIVSAAPPSSTAPPPPTPPCLRPCLPALVFSRLPFALLQKNFGRPVEYALVKDHAWSTPQLRKLEKPVDVEGNPWPLDAAGNPIAK